MHLMARSGAIAVSALATSRLQCGPTAAAAASWSGTQRRQSGSVSAHGGFDALVAPKLARGAYVSSAIAMYRTVIKYTGSDGERVQWISGRWRRGRQGA